MNSEQLNPANPSVDVTRFPSLPSLRAAHQALLQSHRTKAVSEVDMAGSKKLADARDEIYATDTTDDATDVLDGLLPQIETFLLKGRSTGALLDNDEDRWAAQSLLDYWSATLYGTGHTPPDITLLSFDPSLAPELPDDLSPYVGLDAFHEQEHSSFFGRKRLIDALCQKVAQERFIAVVGPSGSGKSSLVLAGLIPTLKAGKLPNSEHWHYAPRMVPGSEPLLNLARLMQDIHPDAVDKPQWSEAQVAQFQADPTHLTQLVNAIGNEPFVLIVDQFEESFTLCDNDEERLAFVNNLVALAQSSQPSSPAHRLILTMRTDFESFIPRLSNFQPPFEKAIVRVTPLSASEIREAIEGPAEQIGLKFEAGLVDALLQDILGEPAALPLLQFTLLKLWENRERNRITWEAYKRLGGGRLALARSADEFYDGLIPEEQLTAKRILLRLVRPSEGLEITSNRVRRESLYLGGEASDRVDRVLAKMLDARLLRLTTADISSDTQVEVAHEALVRNWPRLVSWLEEAREGLRKRLRLTERAEQWQGLGQDPGALLRGTLLAEALAYNDLNELETTFVAFSQAAIEAEAKAQEEARRRELEQARILAEEQRQRADEQSRSAASLRRLVIWLAGVGFIAVLLAIAAAYSNNQAIREQNVALTAQAEEEQQRIAAQTAEAEEAAQRVAAETAEAEAQAAANIAQNALSALSSKIQGQQTVVAQQIVMPAEVTPSAVGTETVTPLPTETPIPVEPTILPSATTAPIISTPLPPLPPTTSPVQTPIDGGFNTPTLTATVAPLNTATASVVPPEATVTSPPNVTATTQALASELQQVRVAQTVIAQTQQEPPPEPLPLKREGSLTATPTAIPEEPSVELDRPAIISFSADPMAPAPGQSITFTWESTGGTHATLTSLVPSGQQDTIWEVPLSGNFVVESQATDRNHHDFLLTILHETSDDNLGDSVDNINRRMMEEKKILRIKFTCPDSYFFSPAPDACPEGPARRSVIAEQHFERGRMLWLKETAMIYLLYEIEGEVQDEVEAEGEVTGQATKIWQTWERFEDRWSESQSESDPALVPPGQRYRQPIRSFGQVWRNEPGVREKLGWAIDEEQGFEGQYQYDTDPFYSLSRYRRSLYVQLGDGEVVQLRPERDEPGGWVIYPSE